MNNLESLVEEYLKYETDYAIQITGQWGIGKTYFYRNVLEKIINKTPVVEDNNKNYIPIYISLFGLKKIENIENKIILEFFQNKLYYNKLGETNKKILKVTKHASRIFFRGVLNYKGIGSIQEYDEDANQILKEFLSEKELVICFDDLERKSSDLNIEDLFGYINSLVDNKIKVLIICNEKKGLSDDTVYSDYKEKIISISNEYNPNTEEVLKNIINQKFGGLYQQYLLSKDRFDFLQSVVDNSKQNYRSLIFALYRWQTSYSEIVKNIINDDKIKEFLDFELINIFKYSIAIAVEFKSDIKFNLYNKQNLNYDFYGVNLKILRKKERNKKEDLTPLETFLLKYNIEPFEHKKYSTVYNYILGKNKFEISEFINEFLKLNHLSDDGAITEEYSTLISLTDRMYMSLGYQEYKRNTIEVVEYARNGKYDSKEYFSILYYVLRMENILELDIDLVMKNLFEGFKISIETFEFDKDVFDSSYKHASEVIQNKNIVTQFYQLCTDYINEYRKCKELEQTKNIANSFTEDFKRFLLLYETNSTKESYKLPFLNYVNANNLVNELKKTDERYHYKFNDFIQDRIYRKKELRSLSTIKSELEQYIKLLINEEDRIKLFLMNKIVKKFNQD